MEHTADSLILRPDDHTILDYQQAIEIELDRAEQNVRDMRMGNRRNSQSVEGFAYLNSLSSQLIESYSKIIQRKLSQENQSNT